MDLDWARTQVMEAPDVPALSGVLLQLLELVGALDVTLTNLELRVADLEASLAQTKAQLRAGLRP